MSNVMESSLQIKKVSLSAVENQKIWNERSKKIGLRDNYYFVHIVFFLLGLMHILPFSFFVTANSYWMEKFRNVSADASDASTRTSLQSYFASAVSVSTSVPLATCILLSTIFGHKLKARSRVIWSLAVMAVCFMIATAFIDINTDSWQTPFFVITMATMVIINSANAVLEIGTIVLLAKFPPHFMSVFLIGEGFAGIFNALMEIICLSMVPSTTESALMYFSIGSFALMITLIMYYLLKYNHYYMYFVENSPEDTTRGLLPFSEIKAILKIIWPVLILFIIMDLARHPTHTSVTSLVVSENHGSGSKWSDVYFVPVITFLYADLVTTLGRLAASKVNKVFKGPFFSAIVIVRTLVMVPVLYLCNAQPREHLPVVFPHDWQYITILGVFCASAGYLFNMCFLSMSELVKPEKLEDAYMVFMACICTVGAVASPLGLLGVKLL